MYDINKYRAARRVGIKAAVALRYARGQIYDHYGLWAQLIHDQRAAVIHSRVLVKYSRMTWMALGRARWYLARHLVRWDAHEAALAVRRIEEEREDEHHLRSLHGRAV